MHGALLEQVLEFKYLGVVLNKVGNIMQSLGGRYRVGGKLQAPSDPWLVLGVCSLSVKGCYMRNW